MTYLIFPAVSPVDDLVSLSIKIVITIDLSVGCNDICSVYNTGTNKFNADTTISIFDLNRHF